MRAYKTHGSRAHRQRVSTTFLTREKLEPSSTIGSDPVQRLTTEPTRHPKCQSLYYSHFAREKKRHIDPAFELFVVEMSVISHRV